jgi:hypothetical protein
MGRTLENFNKFDHDHHDEFVAMSQMLPSGVKSQSDETKLRRWELIEPARPRNDGGRQEGPWRITEKGRKFMEGGEKVPHFARSIGNRLLGLTNYNKAGEWCPDVGIDDIL